MFTLPDAVKRFIQTNKSDISLPISRYIKGNLFYTKNMNFDEQGYAKLSPRAVSITNSLSDTSFNITTSLGRVASNFLIVTTENPYKSTISETTVSATLDTDNLGADFAPTLGFDSHGTWYQNLWHVSTETSIYTKDYATGNWTNKSLSLTTGVTHDLEVFRNRNTLLAGNGNVLKQYTSAYGASTDLTIPSGFEILSISYNNNFVGIGTKLSSSTSGKSGEAYFFTWDGSSTSANAGFGVGSDMIIDVKPYKSSWVILTRTGELMQFNGGGFDQLAILPVNYLPNTWGDSTNREAYGDIMTIKGDLIFFHVNNRVNSYGDRGEIYIPNAPGGVLCYDPLVGIYHRSSPSTSNANLIEVLSSGISTMLNTFTKNSGTLYTTGNPIKYVYDGGTPVGGLHAGHIYYIIKDTASIFRLALTPGDADAGNAIDITSTGASNNYFLVLNELDYGASRMERTGGLVLSQKEDNVLGEYVFGGEYIAPTTGTNYEYLNFLTVGFTNKGYMVTTRVNAQGKQDTVQKVVVKYKYLDTMDSIEVKEKSSNIIGLPVTTPQYSTTCTWTADDTFTTTADLSVVDTLINTDGGEAECEIIAGAGAGDMAQISSITENAGTYTVVLENSIIGASSGLYCDIVIDNWVRLNASETDTINGIKEFSSGTSTKSALYKIILSGSEVAIEEVQIISVPHKT